MALQGQIPIEFGMVFPSGAYAAGGIEMVRDFDRSTADRIVQQADKHTGLPLWVVERRRWGSMAAKYCTSWPR